MKKKILALAAATIMTFGGIALPACGGTGPDYGGAKGVINFTVPEGGYDGSELTLKFYHTMGSNLKDVLKIYIGEFNKIYPQIHIEHSQIGDYNTLRSKITTEIQAGNQPNFAYCYPDHVALFNKASAVATLDDIMNCKTIVREYDKEVVNKETGETETVHVKEPLGFTQAEIDDFIPAYYNEGKSFGDNLMYCLPFLKSTEVLYYNASFFAEHNLEVPKTWDEMEAVCEAVKAIDNEIIPLGYDSEANWFITMCEQLESGYTDAAGAREKHFIFNNDTNKAFVERFAGWYKKGWLITQALNGNTYTSSLFTATTGRRTVMTIGSTAGANYQRPEIVDGDSPFEVGITSIPQVNAAKPKVISQGPSVCIFRKKNPQEVIASWLFIKFLLTSVDFQAEFSQKSGYVPVLKSVLEDEMYNQWLNEANGKVRLAALSAKVCMEQANAYYTSPAFNGSSTARDEVGEILVQVFSGKKTVDQAFRDAVQSCNYTQI